MRKIILRFPTSDQDKMVGGLMLDAAEMTIKLADKFCRNENGTYNEDGILMVQKATNLMNRAAKALGFRNVEDLIEYNRRRKNS